MKRLLLFALLAITVPVFSPEPARGQAMAGEFFEDQRASRNAIAITPSDTTDLAKPTIGIYVGGAGTLKVDMLNSGQVTFSGVPVGTVLHIAVKRVYSTGTSATNLIELY